jgi:hypothetical protein
MTHHQTIGTSWTSTESWSLKLFLSLSLQLFFLGNI